jgi:hypothetical protein
MFCRKSPPMANTYDGASGSDKDSARRLLGDVGAVLANGLPVFFFSDETISGVLAREGFNAGLVSLARGLRSQFAMQPSELQDASGFRVKWNERISALDSLIAEYQRKADNTASGAASVGIIGQRTVPGEERFRF